MSPPTSKVLGCNKKPTIKFDKEACGHIWQPMSSYDGQMHECKQSKHCFVAVSYLEFIYKHQ